MDLLTSKDGTAIAVERAGSGPALVCVAGAFGDRRSTVELAAALGGRFTVWSYDRRGRGSSGLTEPVTVAREIQDLSMVLRAAGRDAALYGHASGAVLAARTVLSGVPVRALALYEPPWSPGPQEPGVHAGLVGRIETAVRERRPGEAATLFLEASGMAPEALRRLQNSPQWPHLELLAPTLPYDLAVVGDGGVPTTALTRIDVPTLWLTGADSPGWLAGVADQVVAVLPAGRHQVLPGQGREADATVLAPVLAAFFAPA